MISYELLIIVLCTSVRAAATAPAADAAVPEPPAELNGHAQAVAERYAADLARGEVPGVRRIRSDLMVGQPRAQQVRAYLAALARI